MHIDNKVKKLHTSVRTKLMVPLLSVVLVLFVFLAISQYISIKNKSEKELSDKLVTNSQLAALVYSNPLWNYNYEGMADIAAAVMLDSEIGSITVKTTMGREIFSQKLEGPAFVPSAMSHMEALIVYQNEPIGIVTVGVTSFLRQRTLERELLRVVFYLLLTIAVVLVVIFRVAQSVTDPIQRLELGTDEFAQGNLNKRITLNSKDEVGRLADKFNMMAMSLSEIIRQRDEVTEELISANDALASTISRQNEEIKDRIKAQEALSASEEKYGKAFKNLAEVVGLTRVSDQSYLEINDVFYKTLGYSPQEVIGYSSKDFNLWANDQEREQFFKLLNSQGFVKNFESRWLTKKGELRNGLQSAEIVTIAGELFEIFIWNDITEIKQAEDVLRIAHDELELKVEERTSELMAMNEELVAMNDELVYTLDRLKKTQQLLLHSEKMAALGGLVAGMSHEISTPIGIGVTSVSYVQKELSEISKKVADNCLTKDEFDEFIAEATIFMQTTAKNLERADLLIRSFKQVSVDQSTEEKRRFNARQYLDELLLSLHPLFRNTAHRVIVDCPDNLEVVTYPGLLSQIITNLITNSLRHGFDAGINGVLELRFDRLGSFYTLTYSDNGLGMESDVLEHIYDPFFTTKRGKAGGTGLGLHLVYNIVTQQLEGEIKCFSEPHKGARFIITFPDLYSE
jgi:PAS domain S-box-containing protein